MKPIRTATILDVSKLAGCSTATVSRALNAPDLVSEKVRAAVFDAVRKLGYVGNSSARALRQSSTHLLGVIIPTLSYSIYSEFVEAIQKRASLEGYSLLLTTSDYRLENEAANGRLLLQRGVEGLILVGNQRELHFQQLMAATKTPQVNTYVYDPQSEHSTIGINNEKLFKEIVLYLSSLGHTKFGMISGITDDNDRASKRVAGFLAGLAKLGVPRERSRVVSGAYTVDQGRQALRRLLATHETTAIVCGSDMLAVGAMLECREMGIRVPEKMSIFGFDDLNFSTFVEPQLTTVRVPSVDLGDRAAEYLLARCRGSSEVAHVRFDPQVVIRGTTGPAPATTSRRNRQKAIAAD